MNDGSGTRNRPAGPRRAARVAALAGIALLAAACSGGLHPAGSGGKPSQGRVQQLDVFARCMRGHGELNFYLANPASSPSPGPNSAVLSIMGEVVTGVNPQTPQFATAMQACKHLLPGGPPRPLTQRQKENMLRFAACIRRHGYPTYPDPQFRNGGVFEEQPPGVDTNAPRFQAVVKACNAQS